MIRARLSGDLLQTMFTIEDVRQSIFHLFLTSQPPKRSI
jgi:hypothetical protein